MESRACRQRAIRGRHDDIDLPVEVGRRRAGEPLRRGIEGEPRGQGVTIAEGCGQGKGIAVHIAESACRYRQVDGIVLGNGDIGERRQHGGRIVHRIDRQSEGRTCRQCTVRSGHDNVEHAGEIGGRLAGETTIDKDKPRRQWIAARQACRQRQRIAINVREGSRRNGEVDSLIFRAAPVDECQRGHRRVVDGRDRQHEGVADRSAAIGRRNLDLDHAMIVGGRRAGEAAAIECQPGRQRRAVTAPRAQHERVAVEIGKGASRDEQIDRAILVCRAIGDRLRKNRRVVCAGNDQIECVARAGRAIAGGDPQTVDAAEVRGRLT